MIQAFILDETSGSNNPIKAGKIALLFIIANEIRGLFVVFEGARLMGWF